MSGKLWKWMGNGSLAAAALLLAGMLTAKEGMPRGGAAAALFLLLFGWYAQRRHRLFRENACLAAERRRTIQTLSRYRHDWMNDLQVLLGYIQLNKQDKVKSHLETIGEKWHYEGRIAKLGILDLMSYLIHYNGDANKMELIVRPERDISLEAFGETGRLAADVMMAMIASYQEAAQSDGGESGRLHITIDAFERELLLLFEYTGPYSEQILRRRSAPLMAKLRAGGRAVVEDDFRKEAADLEVRLPVDGWSEK